MSEVAAATGEAAPVGDGPKPVRIGLLGRGNVGAAFAELLDARAEAVLAATGRKPELVGVLTRSEGDFAEILEGSDLIVELMGGTEPAREYVAAAMRAGRPVVTANKQLLAQHGDELFQIARESGVQLRFEAAVAAVIPVVRTIQEGFATADIERVYGIVNGTTNFILSEMASTGAGYDDVLARAQELGYAEADPTDDVSGADAAAKMAILARLAFHTPVTLSEVSYEGIESITPDDLAFAKELGLSLKLLGVAERRRRGDQRPRLPRLPLLGPPAGADRGRLQRGDDPGAGVQRGDPERPRRGRPADRERGARRRRLDPRRRGAGARDADRPADPRRRAVELLPAPRGRRPAGGAGDDRDRLGDHEVSVKSVVQRGIGEDARLVMVLHECLESQLRAGGRSAQRAGRAARPGAVDPRDRGAFLE